MQEFTFYLDNQSEVVKEFIDMRDSKFVGIAKYSEIKKHSDCLYVIDECFVCSDNFIYKINTA